MTDFFTYVGAAVCHADESRSLIVGGAYLPLCARCTGLYLSFFTTTAYLLIKKRFSGNRPTGLFFTLAASAGMLPLIADGVTSYAGLRESGSLLRLITGALCGAVMPVFFVLAVNYKPERENISAIIKNDREYAILICVPITAGLLLYFGLIHWWYLTSFAVCAGEAAALYFASSLIVGSFAKNFRIAARRFISFAIVAAAIILSNHVSI